MGCTKDLASLKVMNDKPKNHSTLHVVVDLVRKRSAVVIPQVTQALYMSNSNSNSTHIESLGYLSLYSDEIRT